LQPGRASRTAEYMAFFRALETALPPRARRCEDPLARAFLRPSLAGAAALAKLPGVAALLGRYVDSRWPGTRTSAVARTRLLDALLVKEVADGARQLVILGAGFDSRACRLAALREVRVFEVDHPDTQARKRDLLARALGALPPGLRFVATDFDVGGLERAMAAAGYAPSQRTLFLWEGVTNYLQADAVDATLRWCARAAPGSLLLFTYVHADVLERPEAFFGTQRLFATLAASGERWTFGLQPAALADYLRERGLALERDVGANEYRELAWGDAARSMRGYEFYRIAAARVAGGASQALGAPA
jgi:methyltransferase (TIGR00027 family)